MLLLQPTDMGRDDRSTGCIAAKIGIDRGVRVCGFGLWIVEEAANIRVQRGLIGLERQGIATTCSTIC